MHIFNSFFVLEWKKFFNKRNIVLTILFALVSLVFIQTHTQHYKSVLRSSDEVVKLEKDKVKEFKDYTKYATVGITLNLVPPPTSIFFYNSGLFIELASRFDGAHTLDIYVSMKGKNSFSERSAVNGDYSSWLLWVGTLVVLFYGFDTFKKIKYYRLVTSFTSQQKAFWFTLLARYLVLTLLFFALTSCAVILVLLNGISFKTADYLIITIFSLIWLFVSLIFFLIGALIGMIHKKPGWIAIIIWIIAIYLSPLMDNKISIETASPMPSNASLDGKKWYTLNQFETRAKKKNGTYSPNRKKDPEIINTAKSYFNKEYPEIQNIEYQLAQAVQKNSSILQGLWALLPSTFFYSTTHEMSGKGFQSINAFYNYTRTYKDRYMLFFFHKKFFTDESNVQSFVKNKENLFYSSSRLPNHFLLGLGISLSYVLVLLFFLYSRFNSILSGNMNRASSVSRTIDIAIHKGEFRIFEEKGTPLTDILFYRLSGKQKKLEKCHTAKKIQFINLNTNSTGKIDFLFLCSPADLPMEIYTRDFLIFFCTLAKLTANNMQQIMGSASLSEKKPRRLDELSFEERAQILLTLTALKNCELYLFHETATGARYEFTSYFRHFIANLATMDKTVLYLTSDSTVRHKSSQDENYVYENRLWTTQIDIRLEEKK